MSEWGLWADEWDEPFLMEMAVAWVRRKRFEAKVQASALLEAQLKVQMALLEGDGGKVDRGDGGGRPRGGNNEGVSAFDLFGVEEG